MATTSLVLTNKTVEQLTTQLKEKEKQGLRFPANYSLENAMNSAYLMLKETEDKNGSPLLSVCTQESVVNALMQMATQGLNPVKKQCYFVAYGKKCQLAPSYFGTLAILKRVTNVQGEPVANIIYKGDVFEYEVDTDTGEIRITKHQQKLENIDNDNIIGTYAIVRTDKHKVVEIMNINQIRKAWAQGKSWQAAEKGGYKSKAHTNFSEEMAKKTVLNRACKKLINSTDDSSVMGDEFIQAFNETESNDTLDVISEQVAVEIDENANSEDFPEEETGGSPVKEEPEKPEDEIPDCFKE